RHDYERQLGIWGRRHPSAVGSFIHTNVERLSQGLPLWWKSLLHDYAEACREVAQGIRQRPMKAGLYLSLLAGAVSCSLRNPSEASFDSSLLEASGTLLLLSPWTRNSSSEKHTQRLMVLRNRGQLRVQNLAFFSLLYEAPYDAGADLYQAHCKYLKPRWTDFPSLVLDVGFWGRWWVLHSRMQNSDINNEEFQYLPGHLKTISFNDLHSETNEKLFDEKYKAVILTEEQIQEADGSASFSQDKFL
uniref:Translocase of inner mitochondrial membrane 29 n=1 Tax=Laticauda laticaudata TaxID=8630 RepID=A0A8C5SU55_LATLA